MASLFYSMVNRIDGFIEFKMRNKSLGLILFFSNRVSQSSRKRLQLSKITFPKPSQIYLCKDRKTWAQKIPLLNLRRLGQIWYPLPLFSDTNLTLSKTNSLENLGCKDSGNLSSQYSITSRRYSRRIFEYSPTKSNAVKMVSHLFSLEHFARKSRLSLI